MKDNKHKLHRRRKGNLMLGITSIILLPSLTILPLMVAHWQIPSNILLGSGDFFFLMSSILTTICYQLYRWNCSIKDKIDNSMRFINDYGQLKENLVEYYLRGDKDLLMNFINELKTFDKRLLAHVDKL